MVWYKNLGFLSLSLSAVLYTSTALAAVDISEKERVEVGTWSELKAAVEDSANAGKVIVLTGDIQADKNNPITNVGGSGIIIDGGGFTITGPEGKLNGQFIKFDSSDTTDLIIQNLKIDDFYGSEYKNSIVFNSGSLKQITTDFSNNYVSIGTSDAYGGAIYNNGSIDSIEGDFTQNKVYDSYNSFGGAIYNDGQIKNIDGDFTNNTASTNQTKVSIYAQGGAIFNSKQIDSISGNFVENAAIGKLIAQGGAIFNKGTISLENSSFYNNYAQSNGETVEGGAIYSAGDLTIRADNGESIFRGNKVIWGDGEDSSAVYFAGNLKLDSIHNGLIQFDDKVSGSEIKQTMNKDETDSWIKDLNDMGFEIKQDGDNYFASGTSDGIAATYQFIKQPDGTYIMTAISGEMTITGDNSSKVVFNNAIERVAKIDISGTNVDVNEGAGTIYRTITHDEGVLNINTGAKAEDNIVNSGGTLNVADNGEINRTEINEGGVLNVAAGGLAQDTTVNSGGTLSAEAQARLNNMLANGGAILDIDSGAVLTGNIIIHADAEMGGSYDYSQIFKDEVTEDGSLTLVGGLNEAMTESSLINKTEGKRLRLTAGDYVIGDGAQAVEGWDMLTFKDNANVKLEGDITLTGPNKKLIIENGSELNLAGNSPSNYTITGSVSNDGSMTFTHSGDDADDVTTIYGNYTAYNKAQMTIDVNPTANTSDLLRVDGDVAGTTNVVLNIVGADVRPTELIKFVEAANDDLSTGAYFNIFRVNNSAFVWKSIYQDNGWYTGTEDLISGDNESGYGDGDKGNIEDDENLEDDAVLPPNFPDVPSGGGNSGKGPSVVGEAIAYMGLPSAGIEQTRDMTRNITNKVASTKVYSTQCHGFYDCEYDGKALRNAWAAPVYSYSDVKAPYRYEAEISGFEGGFDIQSDVYNRLGVFASYRQGSYDFDGDGDDYYSKTGADMDIDSYILGLYHRYDEGKLWTMGQIFLGYQDVSLSSDDGVSSSTDGIEFGAAVEGGLIFNPMTNLTIEPIIRLAYTQINYDDATDNYGKTAKYGDVRNIEVEAGVKVEKTYLRKNGYAKLYVKPSIIQNIGSGDVQVTSLRKVDGLENSTLGRIEVGGSMSFDEQWSGYANAAYTFGSDYTNLGLNAGLNYAF